MSESLFSTYWYRVADLKPALRDTTTITRHIYREQAWYVLSNRLNGRNHRFNATAYTLIGRMDGRHTVQQIWEKAGGPSGESAPTQDEFIRLLGRLHDADLIQSDILPSTMALVRKGQGAARPKWQQRAGNPFSLRFPLWDPDRFLEKWAWLATPLFSRWFPAVWLLIVLSAVVLAGLHWPELTADLTDRIFSARNLILLWLVYPLVKILHEFGHAFAVKKWGGEVHEMGISLLALTPVPYVDASASAAFAEKKQRMAVAAAGMAVELLLAALALFVWLHVTKGWISAIAFNIMLIGGASTVLFNGNPLLRYDGYYILTDLIEIPNLARRATRYLGYLIQRYVFGIAAVQSPVTAPGEKGWFLIYGPVAFCYRMVIFAGLAFMVSRRYLAIGILIAVWGAVMLLFYPAFAHLTRFLTAPAVRDRRGRMIWVGGSVVLGAALFLFVIPMPLWTTTQGVVWLPEESMIRAGTDCEVIERLAVTGQWVAKDTPLIKGGDPVIETRVAILRARLAELSAGYNAQPLHQRVERKMLLDEIGQVKGDLRQAEEKYEKLTVRSPAQGRFILLDARNLKGRIVKQGELLGYIIADHRPTVRAVVNQDDIGLMRERFTGVAVRLAEQPAVKLSAEVERIIPAADLNLPSAALGTAGGGDIPVDPTDPNALRALNAFFQIDLRLTGQVLNPHIGGRAYVRLEYGRMPLCMQWYRSLRQLFIREFYA